MNTQYEKIRRLTLTALKNLDAENNFVSFYRIYDEVKRLRTVEGLLPEDQNTEYRVRRALVNTKEFAEQKNTKQAKELSIMFMHPQYEVVGLKNVDHSVAHKKVVEQEKMNSYKLIDKSKRRHE